MSQTVNEMFGYERESDDDTIIDNYDDSSSDISMPSDVTVDSDSDSHSEGENDTVQIITTTTDSLGLYRK